LHEGMDCHGLAVTGAVGLVISDVNFMYG
jgi:hypothetical protein